MFGDASEHIEGSMLVPDVHVSLADELQAMRTQTADCPQASYLFTLGQ